jgi:tetratricopeptide (TPR) repeat protein
VEADSDSAPAFFNLGLALYRKSEFQQAENALLKTLNLAPSLLLARLALADVYVKLARLGDALKQLDLYLEKAPECPQRTQAEQLRTEILMVISDRENAKISG